MQRQSTKLRALLRGKTFLHMPSVYDPLGARLVQSLGYEATYVGGYVSGAATAVTEPQLTMTEQIRLAADVAQSIAIPLIVDGGAGFGERAAHHAHGARIHPRRHRRHSHRGPALPQARALS